MHAVFFDLDGTLLTSDRSYASIAADAFREHLGTGDSAVVEAHDAAFFEAFRALAPDPYVAGARAAIEAAGVAASVDDVIAARRALEYDALRLPGEMRSLLEEFADRPLGVLTNGVADWQRGKLDAAELTSRFDAVVTSYEAGAHKPDARIFELAAERLPADGYVMIGDDREADVRGARDAGWQAIHADGVDVAAELRAVLERA